MKYLQAIVVVLVRNSHAKNRGTRSETKVAYIQG